MKNRILILIIVIFLSNLSLIGCNQNKEIKNQKGIFSNFIDENILFFEGKDNDGEYPLYSLKAIDVKTNKQITIANNLSYTNCVKMSNNSLAYTNGQEIISFDLKTRIKKNIFNDKFENKIIGFKDNEESETVIFILQVNYKKNIALTTILRWVLKIHFFDFPQTQNRTHLILC